MKTYQRVQPRFGSVLAGILLLALFATARTSVAQSAAPAAPVPHESESQPTHGTRGEGIKVHGNWTIDVRDPDGSLAAHHEFENRLITGGTNLLSDLLGLKVAISNWTVFLDGANQPCRVSGGRNSCFLVETIYSIPSGSEEFEFNTLTLAVLPVNFGESKLQLAGNFTASFDGDISRVRTIVDRETSPNIFRQYDFSERFLGTTPIPVAAGQHVFVKVTFTFS
jgi:hypothetical protein